MNTVIKHTWLIIAIITGIAVSVTFVSYLNNWDLWLSGLFYSPDTKVWLGNTSQPWKWLYRYGEIVPAAICFPATVLFLASFFRPRFREYRRPMMVFLLTVIIGPGILINTLLKPGWGRPRPADCVQFGGSEQFRELCVPLGPGHGKSFTCGHCAIAAAPLALITMYPLHPLSTVVFTTITGAYAILVGTARIMQGGHYFTDVLWSFVFMLIIITVLIRITYSTEKSSDWNG